MGGFIFKAIKRFLAHLVPAGTPDVLIPLIVVIELVRNFIRPITLSVRLAANICWSLINQFSKRGEYYGNHHPYYYYIWSSPYSLRSLSGIYPRVCFFYT